MSSIVYSCLNFLQHGIITQEISPKNNYTYWKIPILIPLNFPIVRRLPILFIYKLNRLFIAKSCRYLFSYARTIRFYSQTFALVFLRIWNFFASPTKLLIDVNVSHCCEHVNISKAPSRREHRRPKLQLWDDHLGPPVERVTKWAFSQMLKKGCLSNVQLRSGDSPKFCFRLRSTFKKTNCSLHQCSSLHSTVEGNKICEGEVRLKVFSYFLETSLKRFLPCSVRMKLTIVWTAIEGDYSIAKLTQLAMIE